jgi:hypothetical protein
MQVINHLNTFVSYFDIKINEDTLSSFESVLNHFSAAEQERYRYKMRDI